MEYRYSKQLDPAELDTEGLCQGLPFRIHRSPGREDLGAIMAQEDWREIIGEFKTPKASLSPKFSFLSVAFPETIPDRLEILAYFNEYGLLHDDIVEAVNQQLGDEQNDESMYLCVEGATGVIKNPKNTTGRGLMMSKIANKMLSIDRGPATVTLSLWAEWFRKGAGRRNHAQFKTLDEYLEYRIFDVGDVYLIGIGIFGMGLNIPEHEMKLLPGLCRQAWIALSLTNDLFSFAKELKEAAENPDADVSNAIIVVMQERGIDEAEAKELCRHLIRQSIAKFLQTVETTKAQEYLSHDLRVLIESVQYILTGNLAWTRSAPRYNPGVMFNDRQLEWMTYGSPRLVFTS